MLDFRRIKCLGITKENGITRVDGLVWPVFTMEKHPGMRSQIKKYIFVAHLVSTGHQYMMLCFNHSYGMFSGFYFIPEALEVEEQMHWIKESLISFPQPPNRTNHTAVYGPLSDLWSRTQNGEVIEQSTGRSESQCNSQELGRKEGCVLSTSMPRASTEMTCVDDQLVTSDSDANDACYGNKSNGNFVVRESHLSDVSRHPLREQHSNDNSMLLKTIPMKSLLRKLRWATLGLQFDWSKVLLKRLIIFCKN